MQTGAPETVCHAGFFARSLRRDVRIDLTQAALARVETIARGVALNKLTMFAGQHLPLYK